MLLLNNDLQHNVLNVLSLLTSNITILKMLVAENQSNFDKSIFHIVFDPTFEIQLKDAVTTLKKILEQSNKIKMTKQDYSMADAIEDLIKLKMDCSDQFLSVIDTQLNSICNRITLAAYYLHPIYKGRHLHHLSDAHKYLTEIHEFFIDEFDQNEMMAFNNFEDKSGIFEKLFEKNYQSPKIFYRAVLTTQNFVKKLFVSQHILIRMY